LLELEGAKSTDLSEVRYAKRVLIQIETKHSSGVKRSEEIKAPVANVLDFVSNPKNQEKIFVDSDFKIENISDQTRGLALSFAYLAL
jgi:hypothetical protein